MKLRGRLKLIADMTPPCSVVADIGTDHGYIPIYLMLNKKCNKGIASDVRKGPIMSASENISLFKLDDYIETRLGNGLDTLQEGEADAIIIAGMGGALISELLNKGLSKAKAAKTLVLQPMNAIEVLRGWLYENGFEISDEELINEGEKIYNVIVANWCGKKRTLDDISCYIGKRLIQKNDALLEKYITTKLRLINKAINEIQEGSSENHEAAKKYISLRDNLLFILGQLEKNYHKE